MISWIGIELPRCAHPAERALQAAALVKGTHVDKPRNLAKSVTVE